MNLIFRDDQPRDEQRQFLSNVAAAAGCLVASAVCGALGFASALHAASPYSYAVAGAIFAIGAFVGGKAWYYASGHNGGRDGWSWDNSAERSDEEEQ